MKEPGDDDGRQGRRVPYGLPPFQTPLCPCAMEREREEDGENGCEEGREAER